MVRLAASVGWLFCLLVSPMAHAQPLSRTADDVVIDERDAPPAALIGVPIPIEIKQDEFDALTQGVGKLTLTEERARLAARMNDYLGVVDQHSHLTEEQRRKLSLAMQSDRERMTDDYVRLQKKYVNRTVSPEEGPAAYKEILQQITIPSAHPCGERSIFFKVFRKQATPVQWETFLKLDQNERITQTRKQFSGLLTGKRALTEQQLDDITPRCLLKYPHWHPMPEKNPYGQIVLIAIADELQDEIKPLLTDEQQASFEKRIKSAPQLKPHLQMMGLWPIPTE